MRAMLWYHGQGRAELGGPYTLFEALEKIVVAVRQL
jgi:hypothetical protein